MQPLGLQPGWMVDAAMYGRFAVEGDVPFKGEGPFKAGLPSVESVLHDLFRRALHRSAHVGALINAAPGSISVSFRVLDSAADIDALIAELPEHWNALGFSVGQHGPEKLAYLRKLSGLGEHTRVFVPVDDPTAVAAEFVADNAKLRESSPWTRTCATLPGLESCFGSKYGLITLRIVDDGLLLDLFSSWRPTFEGIDHAELGPVIAAGLQRGSVEDDPNLAGLRGDWAGLLVLDPLVTLVRQRQFATVLPTEGSQNDPEMARMNQRSPAKILADDRMWATLLDTPSLFEATRLELVFDEPISELVLTGVPRPDAGDLEQRFPGSKAPKLELPSLEALCEGAILCGRFPPPTPARFADLARGLYASIPTWIDGPDQGDQVLLLLAGHWPNLLGALADPGRVAPDDERMWSSIGRHHAEIATNDVIGLRVERFAFGDSLQGDAKWFLFGLGPTHQPGIDQIALDSRMRVGQKRDGRLVASHTVDSMYEYGRTRYYVRDIYPNETWVFLGSDIIQLKQLKAMPRESSSNAFVLADIAAMVQDDPALGRIFNELSFRALRVDLAGKPGAPALIVHFRAKGLREPKWPVAR